MAVCDASILVALYVETDVHHARCWAWYKDALSRGEPLRAPMLLLVEVAGVLTRAVGSSELALQTVAQLNVDFDLYPLDAERAHDAAEAAAGCRLRGADAIYVALAQELGDVLVSLDEQQLSRGGAVVQTQRP